MSEQDTINLLQECDSGSKMAVSAIDEIMDKVHCPDFKALLKKQRSITQYLEMRFTKSS